ncbi:MAG: glycosyltransferase family 4 protein, partial [Myxococcota bacterium]
TPYYYPAWSYGSTARVVYELTRRLAARGDDVTVLTSDAYDYKSRVVNDQNPVNIEGVKVFYLPNISNNLAFTRHVFIPAGAPAGAFDALRNADVIHIHGFRQVMSVTASILASREKIPYVVSAHGSALSLEGGVFTRLAYDMTVGRMVVGGAAVIHAVSEAEKKQYVKSGVDQDRIKVIYEGISLEGFNELPLHGEFRNRHGISADRKIVLYVGTISPRKGIEFMIKAIPVLQRRDVVLVMAGNVQGAGAEKMKRLAMELGVADRVLFAGLQSGKARLAAYRDSDITIYPTEDEAMGLIPHESLLCGTPVIVGEDCGVCEIVSRAGAGYPVEYGNTIELASAIERLLEDRRRSKQMADRGRAFIERELSWDAVMNKYTGMYEETGKAGSGVKAR